MNHAGRGRVGGLIGAVLAKDGDRITLLLQQGQHSDRRDFQPALFCGMQQSLGGSSRLTDPG